MEYSIQKLKSCEIKLLLHAVLSYPINSIQNARDEQEETKGRLEIKDDNQNPDPKKRPTITEIRKTIGK
ncbi:hypothetical protein RCL_jg24710.t1 [Rhizophagus clarus]|uniref:Uncharacterized protein n=1 Tax=Rhizophagus clarus TaxID=94130 RepID=A0A8H3QZL9_9GLOM|nr:hypothetical protein RCL_jg24710.t1 [Rhizophagus clarus]